MQILVAHSVIGLPNESMVAGMCGRYLLLGRPSAKDDLDSTFCTHDCNLRLQAE